jgi:hypothetical protein
LESQRRLLMSLSCDADVVLDLHCDLRRCCMRRADAAADGAVGPSAGRTNAAVGVRSGPSISFDEALSGVVAAARPLCRQVPIPLAAPARSSCGQG